MWPWFEAAIDRYGWIWIGLTFGFAAKYALLIKKGVKIKPALIAADLLILPMVALISYWLISRAGVDGEGAALITAAATVGADRVVKLYTERFMRQVDALIADEAARRKAIIREEMQTELSAERFVQDIASGKRPMGGE
ncbi:hypothetical protein OSJ57_00040 [Sphingomonas sp. HH69]